MKKHHLSIIVVIVFLFAGGHLQANTLEERLENIVIPKVDFDNAPISDVLEWISNKAEQQDPRGKGVNFIRKLDKSDKNKTVTMDLRNIPLVDLIRYICMSAGLNYRIDENAVFISSEKVSGEDEIKTKAFSLTRSLPELSTP